MDMDGYCPGSEAGAANADADVNVPVGGAPSHTQQGGSQSHSGDSKCNNLFAVFPVKCSILYKWKHHQQQQLGALKENALVQGCCRFPHAPYPGCCCSCCPNEINSTKLNKDETKRNEGWRTKGLAQARIETDSDASLTKSSSQWMEQRGSWHSG